MKCSLGQSLGEFGFGFLEKIHEPIFLVHRLGRITKINEAGRKLIQVSKVSWQDLELLARQISGKFKSSKEGFVRFKVANSDLNIIARNFQDSDFILIEVKR